MAETVTAEQLAAVLARHLVWLRGESSGERADLRSANLSSVNLYGANLRSANLYGADLRSADLSSADLRSANLYGADLSSANLYGADLRSANLYGADLSSANLYGADLRSADLRSANLYGANLRSANLYGADLRSADLRSADLRSANLYGANLPFRVIQLGPIGSRSDYLMYQFDTATVATGCFTGTLDEFAAAVESTHGNSQRGQDYRAAIAMLRDIVAHSAPNEIAAS